MKLADIRDSIRDRDAEMVKEKLESLKGRRNHSVGVERNNRSGVF